jgi:uncharacterized membrane protein
MIKRLDVAHRMLPAALSVLTLGATALLLMCDAKPSLFPPHSHDVFAAMPLVLIAVAYLVYQAIRVVGLLELVKAVLLAVAFLLWAANQLWSDLPGAQLLNDFAIALFVLDMFLVIIGWPSSSPDEAFGESYVEPRSQPEGKTDER